MKNRALHWLQQAENDLEFAKHAIKENFYSQCCFICQQSAEKSLKAVAYLRGASMIKGHSVRAVACDLQFNGPIEEAAKILDVYYISTRYPDALPDGAPFQSFTLMQAEQALKLAELIYDKANHEFHK